MPKYIAIVTLILLAGSNSSAQGEEHEGKFERRMYTEDKIAIMRKNTENHKWASSKRDTVLKQVEMYAKYGDQKLRQIVVPPQVPRGYQVHNFGCPVHGIKVHEKGLYKWIIDLDNPWKVKCPVGGEEYPSNDFGAFLKSGMKDRSLLTGEYADDGWGWHRPGDETDTNYWFVAYYAHWSMMKHLRNALWNLGQAAIYTDDPQKAKLYAHKCAVILWQLAVYYPDYEYSKQSREGKEHNPNYTGKWTNMIWEVYTPDAAAPAYDAIRPFLKDDTQLHQLAGLDGKQIDQMIRERLLMEAVRCITDGSGRIRGNYGMHQKSLILLAKVLDEKEKHPTSQEMIDWVLTNPNAQVYTDMGLRDALENLIYRDGVPYESPGYNMGWVNKLSDIAQDLTSYGTNCYDNARFLKLLTWPFDMNLCGQFTPAMGDAGNTYANANTLSALVAEAALKYVDDPRFAYAARQGNGYASDIFEERDTERIDKYSEKDKPAIGIDSLLFPGYGLGLLQCGSEENRTGLSFSYSSHTGHSHADQLNITFYSQDNALLTDIGYPEQTDAFNHKRFGYFANTIAHNTVTVDARKQQRRSPGKLHAYQANGYAKVIDASCLPYDNVSLYRRANMLIEVSPTQAYLFDAFYVRGGDQHDLSTHSTQADLIATPPMGPVQEKGTLGGEDVPYEQFYDDPDLKDKPLGSVPSSHYKGSGFQFFTNVQRAALKQRAVLDWQLTEPLPGQSSRSWQGIGLRAHVVGTDQELITCEGPLQKYDYNPKTISYLMRRRSGENLASRFVSVYEPYHDKTWIKQVSEVPVTPDDGNAAAAKIELTDGSVHYVYHSLTPDTTRTIDSVITANGQAACIVIDPQGQIARAMLLNGTQLQMDKFKLTGRGLRRSTIASIDYEKGVVEIADPLIDSSLRDGQVLLVAPDGFADCVTFRRSIDATHFSIGDEDLLVAGGTVVKVDTEKKQLVSSAVAKHAQAGMMMLNALGTPVGRVTAINDKTWTLDRAVTTNDFPIAAGDTTPRFRVVMAAVGDPIILPDLILYPGKSR